MDAACMAGEIKASLKVHVRREILSGRDAACLAGVYVQCIFFGSQQHAKGYYVSCVPSCMAA